MSDKKELLILSMLEDEEKTRQEIAKKAKELDSFSIEIINDEFYYSEELLDILHELSFWGSVDVETKWDDNELKTFYSLTELGEKKLKEKLTRGC